MTVLIFTGIGMNTVKKSLAVFLSLGALASSAAVAAEVTEASSAKHAKAATQYRQAIFQLVKSNMGPLAEESLTKACDPSNPTILPQGEQLVQRIMAG